MQWVSSDRRGGVDEDEKTGVYHGRGWWLARATATGGGLVLTALVLVAILGAPRQLLQDMFTRDNADRPPGPALERPGEMPATAAVTDVLPVVFAETEDVWQRLMGGYDAPKMVFFDNGGAPTSCGAASSAVGPFYCAADNNVYLDLSFFYELQRRFREPGRFAQAYVVAHAVGHHVQNQAGLTERIQAQREQAGEVANDQLAIRQELQADCYAGVWAHHSGRMKDHIKPGDIERGLAAAAAVGEATSHQRDNGYVVPESFTHGTATQRVEWFRRGFDSGRASDCNTFEVLRL